MTMPRVQSRASIALFVGSGGVSKLEDELPAASYVHVLELADRGESVPMFIFP